MTPGHRHREIWDNRRAAMGKQKAAGYGISAALIAGGAVMSYIATRNGAAPFALIGYFAIGCGGLFAIANALLGKH